MPRRRGSTPRTAVAFAVVILASGCHQIRQGGLLEVTDQDPVSGAQKADIQIALARTAELRGDTEQAIEAYQKALENDDSRADLYHRLALLHDKKGDRATAIELYKQALIRAPDAAEIHCDLGYSYYLQGRWSEAEASLCRACELQPDLARAHNNLGLLLARIGRTDEALGEFARAGLPEHQARMNLALVATLDGQLDAAAEQVMFAGHASNGADNERIEQMRRLIQKARWASENGPPVSAANSVDVPRASGDAAWVARTP